MELRDGRTPIGIWAVVAALSFLIAACHYASIQSTRDPSFSGRITRLYIIINHGGLEELDSDYTPALERALRSEFAKTRTTIALHTVDPLALNDEGYAQEMARYQPDGVLTMTVIGSVRGSYGGTQTIYYDVSLFSTDQPKRRIWRAQLQASGGTAVIQGKMDSAAEQLVQRMLEDRLIQLIQ